MSQSKYKSRDFCEGVLHLASEYSHFYSINREKLNDPQSLQVLDRMHEELMRIKMEAKNAYQDWQKNLSHSQASSPSAEEKQA